MTVSTLWKSLAASLALVAFVAFALFSAGTLPLQQYASVSPAPSTDQAAPEPEITYDEFGVEVDRYETVQRDVRRNETFAEILTAHNVPYPDAVRAAEAARPVFNVRHLRAGKSLRIYKDDSLRTARLLVYERDPINYVVFDLRDSVNVYEGQRTVDVVQREVSGVISSSLYATLDEIEADTRLATMLSEVYAWQIDFFRIQKGDHFSIVYEEERVDGEPIGVGRILAAVFSHFDDDYYAFLFAEGDQVDYYDEEGNSLRKAFLKAPLKYERISSRYTLRRFHPVQKRYKAHLGTDYAANTGTPIRATADGVVLEAQFKRYNGNYVKIRHNGTYTTGYLHMSRIAKGVRQGTRVRQGDVIGYVGSTGLATGPHLCYRFWKNGKQVDPLRETFPSANPVDPQHRDAFEQVRDLFMPRLQSETRPRLAATTGRFDPDTELL